MVLAAGAVVGEEENPDDAALDNKFTGIAATLPLLCICHAQFVNPGEETPWTLFSLAISCYYLFETEVNSSTVTREGIWSCIEK